MATRDERWMAQAVELSRRGFPAPNPHVGCVIVLGGRVVGKGFHDHAGGPHAEIVALQEAGAKAKGADVYVTLEPCAHQGLTPPCAPALVAVGVKRVVIATLDPNPVAQGGAEWLRRAGLTVVTGILEDRAREANRPFLWSMGHRRPYVCLKAALTADGFMARPDGSSKWITGLAARREGHRLRAEMGVVLVGWRTVVQDDPLLTARLPKVVNQPWRVVLDPDGRLAGTERVFGSEAKTVWVKRRAGSDELEWKGLSDLLGWLGKQGRTGLLVEGGPRTLAGFVREGLFERIELFVSQIRFRTGSSFAEGLAFPPLELVDVRFWGPDAQVSLSRLEVPNV